MTPYTLNAGLTQAPLQVSEASSWSSMDGFPKTCSLAAFLTANLNGSPQPPYLLWTRHGVVVKREILPPLGCIGATMILCGDELSVDLGGLRLIEGQLFEQQRSNALVLTKQALIELAGTPENLIYQPADESVFEAALTAIGLRKNPADDWATLDLEFLRRQLEHLGNRYWKT